MAGLGWVFLGGNETASLVAAGVERALGLVATAEGEKE